ncbi:MAG: type II toxin-antitoxin system RelE/ParE family toxin [Devosia sp.]|nr:type II toxin-antitoxin system RelE/ParE family toxin [Devosia sp.]
MSNTKPIVFLGDALVRLRDFPEAARKEAGVQLHKVQMGLDPSDWKHAVYVLHVFRKKTQQTTKHDLEVAASRLKQI